MIDELGDLSARDTGILEEVEGDVFFDGEGIEEGGLLEDHADAVLVQVVFNSSGAGNAVEVDLATIGRCQSGDDAEEAGFSGAGWADEG